MKLYEFPPTRSIRVRWMLQELGVPFESVVVDMTTAGQRRPEFLAINPTGKLPAFVDGDLVLTESGAIVTYLGDKFPESGFLPQEPRARAEVMRWLFFTVTELEQPLWRIARQTNLYPKDRRAPDDVPLARNDFTDMARVLEAHMDGREFVAGTSVTVADFVLAHTLDWANLVKLLADFPRLRAYLDRMYARPHAPMQIAKAFESVGRPLAGGPRPETPRP